MVDKPIELPANLGDDFWARVHQARMTDRVRPVRDHNRDQREEQEAERRDSFERQFPNQRRRANVAPESAPRDVGAAPWRFLPELPLEKPAEKPAEEQPEQAPPQPGKGENLDLQA